MSWEHCFEITWIAPSWDVFVLLLHLGGLVLRSLCSKLDFYEVKSWENFDALPETEAAKTNRGLTVCVRMSQSVGSIVLPDLSNQSLTGGRGRKRKAIKEKTNAAPLVRNSSVISVWLRKCKARLLTFSSLCFTLQNHSSTGHPGKLLQKTELLQGASHGRLTFQ